MDRRSRRGTPSSTVRRNYEDSQEHAASRSRAGRQLCESLKRAADIEEFLADRFGRYWFGRNFLVWCADPTIGGLVFWGTPDEDDVRELERIFNVDIQAGREPPYDLVADGRRLDRVSKLAFDPFARAVVKRLREQDQLVKRLAIIVPEGLVGAVMAGFFPLFQLGDRYRVFREAEAAFRWIERGPLSRSIEALVDERLGDAPAVASLREWLRDHLGTASVREAARALGRSSRSLQRELGVAGTTFRNEIDRARVAAARLRLADSDDKLEVIARSIGCSSLSSFSRLFRRLTGESPTEFRARVRTPVPSDVG
jgi:AraC-like DNA-binding protein